MLTRRLLALGAFPPEAAADAAHVGIAAVNRVDYLLRYCQMLWIGSLA